MFVARPICSPGASIVGCVGNDTPPLTASVTYQSYLTGAFDDEVIYLRSFFIGEHCLGEAQYNADPTCSTYQATESVAYFCPGCGEVWARVILSGTEVGKAARLWQVYQRTCGKCPTAHPQDLPGSLILASTMEILEELPKALWETEFQQHLRWKEEFLARPTTL